MTNLTERLRHTHEHGIFDAQIAGMLASPNEAADRIEKLEAALKPFADCCDQIADDESDEEWAKFRLLIKNYRDAKVALDAR